MIKWLLFDKDGTLVKFDETWKEISIQLVEDFANEFDIKDLAQLKYDLGYREGKFIASGILASGTLTDIAKKFTEHSNENDYKKIEAWTTEESKSLVKKYNPQTVVIKGLVETLKKFKEAGYHIGIITSDDIDGTNRFISDASIEDLIEEKLTASIGGVQKPNPEMIEPLMRKYHLKPEEIAIIGDTPIDIQMGRNSYLGKVIGVLSGTGTETDLQEADYVFKDIVDFYHNREVCLKS